VKLYKIIASGLGTGYAPVAPGTAGSAMGILLFYGLNYLWNIFNLNPGLVLLLNFLVILVTLLVGVHSIKRTHGFWPHDASQIVIDEIVGVWIAVYAVPFEAQYYLYAFILFRFFDIAKPFFIKKLDKKESDWSVMLDDVLAGFYSLIVLQVLIILNVI